ncbi:MAG: glycosyltransferase family 39 protein [Elusimicrobiota bacterium]|nr:glycosyltransferase family 39 protein [Elusimicrobiota bacterium]
MRRLAAAVAASAGLGALWLALPDKTFVFDGVMFAGFVERGVEEWRRELYNTRHLLFSPFFQLLRDGLARLGLSVGAYRLFQAVNALLGVAGLWLFGDLLRRLTRDASAAALGALVLASTWTYGTRATEGQVYMFLAFGCLATLWAATRLLEAPSPRRAFALAVALAVATLFHAAAAFLLPAVLLAWWRAFPGRRGVVVAAVGVFLAALVAPYLAAFGGMGLKPFLSKATDYHGGAGGGFFAGLVARFWTSGGLTPAGRLLQCWRETALAWAPLPDGAAAALGLALWATAFGALAGSWRALGGFRRDAALVLAAAWGGFLVLNAFWLGGLFFQPVPTACLLALLAVSGAPRLAGLDLRGRRGLLSALAFIALCLGASNLKHGLLPQSRIENNRGMSGALFVRDHTVPSSWVVITGFGLANAKVYIPNFAQRSREVIEYYFDRNPKDRALAALSAFVRQQTALGVPLYVLSDLIEDAAVHEEMRRRWGVTVPEIQGAFGAGRVILMARGPDLTVYLFAPAGLEPELFAGLSYSALTESDQKRLDETVVALKELARGMTPDGRARAGALMKRGNWGFDAIERGFAPYMGEGAAAKVSERRARFAALQKTADFSLRAGNLLRILGLKADALAAFQAAHRLSGDAGLLKDIEALRRAP